MPRIAYWDCFSGISGDMALGALLDAGLELGALRAELEKLDVDGWQLDARPDVRYHIAGTHARVHTIPQEAHRHLSDIQAMLNRSHLQPAVRERALAVFGRLAEAEAAVHGTRPEDVHFHEVGALDAIVDIVGVVAGLTLLGVEQVYASALPLGSGWIEAAHGPIPVPGPAVLALLSAVQAPVRDDDTPFELVTPTGAALLAELATFRRPPLQIERVGYGFGTRDTGRLNAVRLWIGASSEIERVPAMEPNVDVVDSVVMLEANIDDQPGEQLAFASEQLLAAGALDVWWQSIGMKKGRPGVLISALASPNREKALVEILLRETSTLGVRRQVMQRWVCERELREVRTPWGQVRVKIKRLHGAVLGFAPEYEDCARTAREYNVPLQAVFRAAGNAAEALLGPSR